MKNTVLIVFPMAVVLSLSILIADVESLRMKVHSQEEELSNLYEFVDNESVKLYDFTHSEGE